MSTSSLALSPPVTRSRTARRVAWLRGRLAILVAAATLLPAWGALVLTHRSPRPVASRSAALHLILSDRGLRQMLTRDHWQRAAVTPMDGHYEEVGFYRGPTMVATVTVGRTAHGLFMDATDLTREKYAYGSNIANDPRVLAGLVLVFVLMTAVWPLWRLRNLDALVTAGTAVSVILFNHWTLGRMVLISYSVMIYLALRCAWQALAPPGSRLPARPLYDTLTSGWSPTSRVRMLRLTAAALALITLMVGVTSLHVLDVGYAVMEGATDLVHGVLPYGHIADILHGDTYPLASYLLYVPFAAVWPVHSAWDNADATLFLAAGAALLAAWGVWRLSDRGGSGTAGLRAAIALLSFPPLLVTVSTGTTDVVLAAMLVAGLVLWRRPAWASATLSGAAWFKAAPALLIPLVLARLRGRDLARAMFGLVCVSVVLAGVLVGLGGLGAPGRMASAIGFQFERSSPHALWAFVGSVPLQQLAAALTLALVAGGAMKLRRDPALAADRTRVAALFCAVLLGVQIAASYWNYMYLVWTLPFLVLALFPASGGSGAPGVETR